MNFWFLIIILGIAFFLQFVFTILQIRLFSSKYKHLRNIGKVAIGTVKGGFRAGAIVMFAIDNHGNILKGVYICGVTILARFREITSLKNVNIKEISITRLIKFPKQVQKAILNASSNYNIIMNGGEIEQSKSIFVRTKSFFNKAMGNKKIKGV